MKGEGGFPPCCLLTFQGKKSTVDSWADCKRSVSSAARSRRVLLRVCTLFSSSPAVDQPLLTFQRSHGILTVAGSKGAAASAALCCGQHWPPPFAAFTTYPLQKVLVFEHMKNHCNRQPFNFYQASEKSSFFAQKLTNDLAFIFTSRIYLIPKKKPWPPKQLCIFFVPVFTNNPQQTKARSQKPGFFGLLNGQETTFNKEL